MIVHDMEPLEEWMHHSDGFNFLPVSLSNRLASVCILILLPLVVLFSSLQACSVPVYYYALVRWQPNDHHIVAPTGSKISSDTNGDLELSNVGRLTACFPNDDQPWWDKPVTGDPASAVALLTNSPVRQEIAKRLSRADTAVWILLESGDAKADDQAEALLRERFDLVVKAGTLPNANTQSQGSGPGGGDGAGIISSALPPRIAFSVIRLSRTAAAEEALKAQLLHINPAVKDEKGPIAFAVFGRGHAFPPLCGPGLSAEEVDSVCLFLIGACSCEVKERLPGRDLLLTEDWNKSIEDAAGANHVNPPKSESVPATPKPIAPSGKHP
jgi:hypothetical protein